MIKSLSIFPFLCFLVTLQTQAQPLTPVVISQSDLSTLGGWPLDRKFYGLLIETLSNSGCSQIYFDFAFPSPDLLHPESDSYFSDLLQKHQSVFILNHLPEATDSIRVLNQINLPAYRTFPPFSKLFSIRSGDLFTTKESLADFPAFFSDKKSYPDVLTVSRAPDPALKPVPVLDILAGKTELSGSSVFIYLDLPGVTSYLSNPDNDRYYPTGFLYVSALNAIISTQFKTVFSLTYYLLFILPVFIPFAFLRQLKSPVLLFGVSLLLGLGTVLTLSFSSVWIPGWFYFVVILPITGLTVTFFNRKRKSENQQHTILPQTTQTDELTSELTDLKYRLNFYENLSSVIPDSLSESIISTEGLIFHKNSPVNDILKKAGKIAGTDIPVMLFGESGTGKERVARFIHLHSSRSKRPFIAVNCGSFNENLIESELFGYEKGAFTGALQSKPGRFELADGGTLFLDEIGETSPGFQVKLLRVLQEGVFERVGGVTPLQVSVRIITATHQQLDRLINEKKFREDLFYRLNGFVITLPPLRERPMDIEAIFADFLNQQSPEMKYSEALVAFLCRQEWKGNVRQLLTSSERALVNAELRNRKFLIPEDFELPESAHSGNGQPDGKALQILASFRTHRFKHRSFSSVASELGLHRVTVTDYFRGWLIRYYIETGSAEGVFSLFKADGMVEDPANFQARIDDYLSGILEKIDSGLSAGERPETILSFRFKNLPSQFSPDLLALIEKRKKELNP